MSMDTTVIPRTYAAGNGISLTNNTIAISDDAIGLDEINFTEIVGLKSTNGKVNTINSTNFDSLNGANLTNISGALNELVSDEVTGSAVASLDYSGLTAYDFFVIYFCAKRSGGSYLNGTVQFNGANTNYANKQLTGNGSAAASDTAGGTSTGAYIGASTDFFSSVILVTKALATLPAIVNVNYGSDSNTACVYCKWNETSNKITQFTFVPTDGQWEVGTSVKILGGNFE